MSKPILFNDFSSEPKELVASELRAVEKVINSGWWILGDHVKQFEAQWSAQCGASDCVATANGLDALEIGLRSLGIGQNDEVVTTSMTAYATTLAIIKTGATPVYADIDPTTGCICPKSVSECLSSKTKAIVVVHLYGRSADLMSLKRIAEIQDIYLVEDCAQAHLAKHSGSPVGTFGEFAAWSFYPTKNLGTIGDAGALTSQNSELLNSARKMRNYGQSNRYQHDVYGMNSRMDELHAAILLQRLPFLGEWTSHRQLIALKYWNEINNPALSCLKKPTNLEDHVHHLFIVLSEKRDKLSEYLKSYKIPTLIHYPIPCHLQKAHSDFRISPNGLPNTQSHAATCLSLPIHPNLTESQVSEIITIINSFNG